MSRMFERYLALTQPPVQMVVLFGRGNEEGRLQQTPPSSTLSVATQALEVREVRPFSVLGHCESLIHGGL
jgi:hypothetical protein